MEPHPHAQRPVVRRLIECLRSDPRAPEPYVFGVETRIKLVDLLDEIFAGDDPLTDIDHLMYLGLALEGELNAPTAADVIRQALLADPRVARTLAAGSTAELERRRVAVETWCGGVEELRAPSYGDESPEGTVKSSAFVNPFATHLIPRVARGTLKASLEPKARRRNAR
jgi:hypothetical protein